MSNRHQSGELKLSPIFVNPGSLSCAFVFGYLCPFEILVKCAKCAHFCSQRRFRKLLKIRSTVKVQIPQLRCVFESSSASPPHPAAPLPQRGEVRVNSAVRGIA